MIFFHNYTLSSGTQKRKAHYTTVHPTGDWGVATVPGKKCIYNAECSFVCLLPHLHVRGGKRRGPPASGGVKVLFAREREQAVPLEAHHQRPNEVFAAAMQLNQELVERKRVLADWVAHVAKQLPLAPLNVHLVRHGPKK